MNKRLIIFIIVMVLSIGNANAFSCAPISDKDRFLRSDIVITARVTEHLAKDKVLLDIQNVWKGFAPKKKRAIVMMSYGEIPNKTKPIVLPLHTQHVFFLQEILEEQDLKIALGYCSRFNFKGHNIVYIEGLRKYRDAIEKIDKEIEEANDNKALKIKKVRFLKENKDFFRAEALIKELLHTYPKDTNIILLYAEILFNQALKYDLMHTAAKTEKMKALMPEYYDLALELSKQVLLKDSSEPLAQSLIASINLKSHGELDSDIVGVDLSGIRLNNIIIGGHRLKDTSFVKSIFQGISIRDTEIHGSNFEKSVFEYLSVANVKLTSNTFDKAVFFPLPTRSAIIFNDEFYKRPPGFTNSSIQNSSFKESAFAIPIIHSEIKNSKFMQSRFMTSKTLENRVIMKEINAENANFQNTFFSSYHDYGLIQDSVFKNCNFHSARFERIRFKNVDFSSSNLKNVSLKESEFDCKTIWPEGFDPFAAGAIKQTECDK